MADVKIGQFPAGSLVTGEDLIPASQNGVTGIVKVKDIRNIGLTIEEGGAEKTASNENLKTVNEKIETLSQSVDSSFQTVNQNFTNVENEIQSTNNALGTTNQNITNHEGDSDLHVTKEKQTKWDGYATSLSDKVQGKGKIYTNTNKSDLGLTFPATTTRIIEAMVDNSILSIMANKATILSDAPGNYGHLYIFKNDGRSNIEFNQYKGLNSDAIPDIAKFIGSYMAGTTTKFSGWKQVATTDDVAVNTASINTINTKLVDSGWIDITLNSGFTSRGAGFNPQYRKIGNRIYLRGQLVGDLTTSTSLVATLPSGFRPSAEQTINGILNNTTNYYGWIAPSGAINFRITVNTTAATVSLTSIPSFLVD